MKARIEEGKEWGGGGEGGLAVGGGGGGGGSGESGRPDVWNTVPTTATLSGLSPVGEGRVGWEFWGWVGHWELTICYDGSWIKGKTC